jgi:hypothetical protein
MTARIKTASPLVLAAFCFGVAFGIPLLPDFGGADYTIWFVIGMFFFGGLVFIWAAFRRTPELEITDTRISIRGIHFDRGNIRSARVFWANYDGRVRFIELQFKKMPRLSMELKVLKIFEAIGFPKKCELGIPLSEEPRIILQLNSTDLSDEDLNHELNSANKPWDATGDNVLL